tara:strand:+ start:284 stop:637 length:354 start_codon:yes stop_codon:yes gene_type:complete
MMIFVFYMYAVAQIDVSRAQSLEEVHRLQNLLKQEDICYGQDYISKAYIQSCLAYVEVMPVKRSELDTRCAKKMESSAVWILKNYKWLTKQNWQLLPKCRKKIHQIKEDYFYRQAKK